MGNGNQLDPKKLRRLRRQQGHLSKGERREARLKTKRQTLKAARSKS